MNYSKETLDTLKEQFGFPLYVFDEKGFVENYLKLEGAMKARYGEYKVAYSFKTNYTPYICSCAKALGAYAEVVSGMEYTIAKKIGYEDSKIVFNGPEKGQEGIDAFLNGCIINADSLDELETFCSVAESNPHKHYKIGIRINLNIGQDFVSRFGMDEEDIEKAFQMVSCVQNLKIVGLHCHISRCRGKSAWKKRTEKMLELSSRFFEGAPEYIDLGSGMFGSMEPEFAAQFEEVPTYEEYAEVTAGLVAKHFNQDQRPILFTEPGTTLINRFVDCAASIKSIKKIKNHYFAILDASEHTLGETCTLKDLPIKVVHGNEPQRKYDSIDLTGYTCLEQDVLLHGFHGELAKDDFVVFGNTGGYSNVLKPPFIRPGSAMVAKKMDGSFQEIKRAESYEDVLKTYIF